MEIEIRDLKKEDYKKAIDFAIEGMHFEWYFKSKFLLKLYGKYFWYLEMSRATQIIAAYIEDEFVGVLLAEMDGEMKKYTSFWSEIYIKICEVFQRLYFDDSVGVYDEVNEKMFEQYSKSNNPDGEITFLAANTKKTKGIGTKLLEEFESRQKGKEVYLYTDDACSYQFYENRGFKKVGEENIILNLNEKVPLTCFLYSKKIK